jgi:solute carrier family 8 (sodium/calcium exchanger)
MKFLKKVWLINVLREKKEFFFLDEHFSVKLSNLKIKDNQGRLTPGAFDKTVQLVEPSTAVVMIIDDDHSGMFVFDTDEKIVVESDRCIEIKILRTSGARGRVSVPYATEDETALNDRDYISKSGEVIFENNENEYVLLMSYKTYVDIIYSFLAKENNRKLSVLIR